MRKLLPLTALGFALAAPVQAAGWEYKDIADALHSVMEADRTVYTKLIINRLQNKEKVIKASEHWEDEKALVLPAQMFRYGAEHVAEKGANFSYSLLSLWPVNKQNNAKTPVEKEGLKAVLKGKPYYKTETLAGKKYFTAIYPDTAVAQACITCHNGHKDSPRTDFKMGDVMGGVVLRLPMN
ncbi:MAG: Tll0287-like domain-containing protein [Thiobacillus sp.]